jgi:hypothetical protein
MKLWVLILEKEGRWSEEPYWCNIRYMIGKYFLKELKSVIQLKLDK